MQQRASSESSTGWACGSAATRVVQALHPLWGVWLLAGWHAHELGEAERWWREGWEPADALRWHREGFTEPRFAQTMSAMGWRNPTACRLARHLADRHGLSPASELRALDAGMTTEAFDGIHRELHAGTDGDLFAHERRFDASGFVLVVDADGGVSVQIEPPPSRTVSS